MGLTTMIDRMKDWLYIKQWRCRLGLFMPIVNFAARLAGAKIRSYDVTCRGQTFTLGRVDS